MAPQSRGQTMPSDFQTRSTPDLSTISPFDFVTEPLSTQLSPATGPTSPSEAASVEDNTDTIADLDDFSLNPSPPSTGSSTDSASDTSSNPDADDFAANRARTSGADSDIPLARRLHGHKQALYTHSSRSHSRLPPHPALYPPFYNRPPTPLPPSPSLTSLLRPSFSTTTSRPTTPDSSDVETGSAAAAYAGGATRRPGSSGAATASSFRTTATGSVTRGSVSTLRGAEEGPVPPTAPRLPTYESYGFALYLFSSLAFLMYILWAYVPSPILHSLGLQYYPDRWWALAVPAWLVVGVIYIYVALASYNTGYLTLKMENMEVLVDEVGRVAGLGQDKADGGKSRNAAGGGLHAEEAVGDASFEDMDWRDLWDEGTDAVMDVPIGGVCEILYGAAREREGDSLDGCGEDSLTYGSFVGN